MVIGHEPMPSMSVNSREYPDEGKVNNVSNDNSGRSAEPIGRCVGSRFFLLFSGARILVRDDYSDVTCPTGSRL